VNDHDHWLLPLLADICSLVPGLGVKLSDRVLAGPNALCAVAVDPSA